VARRMDVGQTVASTLNPPTIFGGEVVYGNNSVRERTCEIGLRQALEAKTRDILSRFLVEAVTRSITGGCAGIMLGIVTSAIVSRLAGWNTVVSLGAVALAVFFSALVGISLGYYPARRPRTSIPSRLCGPNRIPG